METKGITNANMKKQAKALGSDISSKEYREKVLKAAEIFGDEAVRVLNEDLKNAVAAFEKNDWTKEEKFDVPPTRLHMNVVKMKNGGLLLFAPVKVRVSSTRTILYTNN